MKPRHYNKGPNDADHYKIMCNNLHEELASLIERLRYMRLQNFTEHVERQKGWGDFHPAFSKNMMTDIRRSALGILKMTIVESNLTEERKFKEKLLKHNKPTLPGSLYLAPSTGTITRSQSKPLFPKLPDV